jgi:hypothetical protein
MNQLVRDYRNFRTLADQARWRALANTIRAAFGWKLI